MRGEDPADLFFCRETARTVSQREAQAADLGAV
jgi:hypothetical protein